MKINEILKKDINISKNIKLLALSNVLDMDVNNLLLCDKDIGKNSLRKYKSIINKLNRGLPIQYILKEAYFYDDSYYVNRNVLIPRPETEVLVLETEKLIKDKFDDKLTILDVGTGSGVIAITMKKLNEESKVIATDISKKALKVAKKNSKEKNIDVKFINTNIMDGVDCKIDIIISNPPYIDINDSNIEDIVKNNEPHIALFAEDKGLYFYEQILKDSKRVLNKKSIIAFEIGYNLKDRILGLIDKYYPEALVMTKKDYNQFDRYIFIINE